MPLPKTETIAARATEVYCEVWSVIWQQFCNLPPIRSTDLKDLSQLLPYLRQLLTCCACAGLLDNAMVSLTCGHCYCFDCQFREPLLKIHCRQCRERTGLVIERQLQLVVNCYKTMCHILGEQLRKESESAVFDSPVEPLPIKAENNVGSPEDHAVQNKPDSNEVEQIGLQLPSNVGMVTSDSSLDPIAEIVREVEKGTKVSRAIFVIKPPSKYTNAKVVSVAKKDLVSSGVGNKASRTLPESPGKEEVTSGVLKISVAHGDVDKDAVKLEERRKPSVSASAKAVKEVKRRMRKRSHLTEKLRRATHTQGALSETTPSALVDTPTTALDIPISTVDTPTTVPKTAMSNSRTAKVTRSLTRKANNGHSQAKKKRKDLTLVSQTWNTESKSIEMEENDHFVGESESITPPMQMPYFSTSPLDKLENTVPAQEEIKVQDLSVCTSCLDSRYLEITPDSISLLPQEQLWHKLERAKTASRFDGSKTSDVPGEWKRMVRKRVWDPLCPSVTVKRRGEDIAKMMVMLTNAAKVRRRWRQRSMVPMPAICPQLSFLSSSPPSRSSPLFPNPPFPPQHMQANDLSIPDMSFLTEDAKDSLLEGDIDWTDFSSYFEGGDDESFSSLSSSLNSLQLPPPPLLLPPLLPLPPHPHNSELGPFPFREFEPQPIICHHPQQEQQRSPQRHGSVVTPPLPFPRPSHLPRLSPHTPPIMQYSPMMGPTNMSPHNTFYSPLTPGGIRPDFGGGGYTSPVTPRRDFPPCPPDGLFHRHPRPRTHLFPAGDSFPFPAPGGRYSPGGRGYFPRSAPSTPPVVISKQKKSPASAAPGKLKIKSPATNPKSQVRSPSTLNKKRRSPGYSEAGWRCRCGTNNVMFPDKVCAKGKCPCYTKGIACRNCLCRYCHNPFGARELTAPSPDKAENVSVDQ